MSPDAPTTPRARARAAFQADLLAVARARIAAEGAAQLSLRAVARDLGVASSAVYRYVESRDALLTMLLVESYDEVAEACEAALARAVDDDAAPGQTWLAVGRAFRTWAVEHRHSYELIYGTPVPGYAAPQDTVPHATRVWAAVAAPLLDAHARGVLGPSPADGRSDDLVDPFAVELAREMAGVAGRLARGAVPSDAAAALVVRSFSLFEALLGALSAELFGHLHRVVADPARAFDVTLATVAAGVGLRVDLAG